MSRYSTITLKDGEEIIVVGSPTTIIDKCNTEFIIKVTNYNTRKTEGYRRDSIEKINPYIEKNFTRAMNNNMFW